MAEEDPQKLYCVDVWFDGSNTIMVAATDGAAAEELAKNEIDLADALDELSADATEVDSLDDVPEGWRDAYPYGDLDETCEERFARLELAAEKAATEEAARAPDPRQIQLPGTEKERR